MGGMEAVITGLSDDFQILKRNRKAFTFATAFGTFLVALLCITNVSIPPPHRTECLVPVSKKTQSTKFVR